ncbi:hypothetical protein [Mammaliicoccus sp. D-M17]|uniref:hypothetical protein n=1 Tax=Mammaliicoccus sp. D-M17 TaxID=2898677 RepID=UPI001EFB610B|nr:hypothetical protein [Mammaliicoccus sp. D-M17]
MSNKLIKLNRSQMEQMREQADFNLQMYDKLTEMEREFRELNEEIRKEFDDFKNTVPLTGPQSDRLHSYCSRKGHQFTKQFFGEDVSQELYSKKYGHLIRGIFTVVKKKYEVSKYTQVRRIEGEQAIAFVENLTLTDLPYNYMRLTDSQTETAEKHGDYNILKKYARPSQIEI